MTDASRRNFLRLSALFAGTTSLPGCGAGAEEETLAAAAGPAPSPAAGAQPPAPAPSSPPSPPPPPSAAPAPVPSAGSRRFSLLSTSTQTAPFCVGFALRMGDIPAGSGIAVSGATAQATVKNFWPDGSAKFAVVAGTAPLTSGVATTVSLAAGTSSSGAALTHADLQAAMAQPVMVGCGGFGAATWSDSDWASPFQTWVSGHLMSSWVYRKPVGSDAHLVAWLEVRLYAGGLVEILPWIENGYLLVSGPTNKSATYTFTLGGTQRFNAAIDLLHHQRTPLVSGSMLSHWLGADPNVTPVHDTAYLQATGLVPAYHAKTPASAAAITSLPATFAPLQLGSFVNGDGMGGGGYSNHIGLLPEWEVVYLTAPSAATFNGVVRNGYSFGRYNIHYREDPAFATASDRHKPARLSNHPMLNIAPPSAGWETTPATSGGNPAGWATSHHPSSCFVAYLATGRRYFLDEVQFAACTNALIDYKSTARGGGLGLFKSQAAGAERHVAWCLRTLAQALAVTPDDDTTFKAEFRTQFQNNIDYYHQRYVGTGGVSSPIFNNGGFIEPYVGASVGVGRPAGSYWVTIWMQDFVVAALGYAKDLGLGLASEQAARLNEFFDWKAQSVVRRFGFTGSTEWLFRDYGPYYLQIAATDTPNWTTGAGPWMHPNWGSMYAATYSGSNPLDGSSVPYSAPGPKVEGDASIRTWYVRNSGPIAALPGLAYAAKHGVAGAAASYQRLTSASNWASMKVDLDAQPVWAVAPGALER